MPAPDCSVLVVGGGPAGLRAAEVASATGARVVLCDGQRSVGRKFLVAGRGGLNLTHGEPVEKFPARYRDEPERWRELLREFGPDDLRAWAAGLGIETYVGTSGRIFPRGQKAAGLLHAWVRRLRAQHVEFRTGARLLELHRERREWCAQFQKNNARLALRAGAVVLALGGASWPETGSDGTWPNVLRAHGAGITPWAPANCGWEVDWPAELLARAEGLPLKNIAVTAGAESVCGELLITRYGLEGGAIYRLGPVLRAMAEPQITIDFKPQLALESLGQRKLKLSPAAKALLETFSVHEPAALKHFTLRLLRPRPIAEAISSAGGVRWDELDGNLMLSRLPGVFLAGEMLDWEAPTGGYLLQGCFSTGTRAGRAAAEFARLR